MNSYVPYNGSKSRAMKQLAAILHPLPGETYIEGFLGGGSVFFGKPKARLNVLNDADPDVMGMHQAVAGNPRGVMKEMKRLPTARLQYDDIRRLRETGAWWELTPEQRAARMIYLYACAVNAKTNSPFPASPMTRLNYKPDRDLRPWAEMLSSATLECLHIQELLDRYVLKQKKLRCLIFLDPPYVIAAKNSHYRLCFDAVDHLLLARKLALINEKNGGNRAVRIVLSYDDHEYIRALYRPEFGWRVGTLSVPYAGGHHRHATDELLITNFDPADMPPVIEAASVTDWPDVPGDGLMVSGRQFADLSCCERERFDMLLHAKCRGECRACHSKLVA